MNINLHIERLILEDLPFSRSQGTEVQAAVETELSRLLTERGLTGHLANGGAFPSVPTSDIQIAPSSDATAIGHQIAVAVHGGLNQ